MFVYMLEESEKKQMTSAMMTVKRKKKLSRERAVFSELVESRVSSSSMLGAPLASAAAISSRFTKSICRVVALSRSPTTHTCATRQTQPRKENMTNLHP